MLLFHSAQETHLKRGVPCLLFMISGAKLDFFYKIHKKSNKKISFFKKKFQNYSKMTIFVENLQQKNDSFMQK